MLDAPDLHVGPDPNAHADVGRRRPPDDPVGRRQPVDDGGRRDPVDPDALAGGDDVPRPSADLARPFPPVTWRDRLDDLVVGLPSTGRVVAAIAVLAVVAVVAWRLLAPPSPPPEMAIPFADPAASGAGGGAAGADATEPGAAGDPVPAGAVAPGSAATGAAATDSPAGGEIVVHVVGAVASPGVQHLPAGSRVADAVAAAGGASPDADLSRINLAAIAADGQQVYVLRVGEQQPPPPAGGSGDPGADALVNINTASASQLEELPGVGPATAEAIIAHRDQRGPFGSVDDLLDVRGIGEAKLEQIRDRATV